MDSKKMNPQKIRDFIVNDKNPTKMTNRIIKLLREDYPNINTLHRKFGDIRKAFSEEDKKNFQLEYSLLALTQEEIANREKQYKENRDKRNENPTQFKNEEMKRILKIAETILKEAENKEANAIAAALALATGRRMVEICRVSILANHPEPNKIYIFGLAKTNKDKETEPGYIRQEEATLLINMLWICATALSLSLSL
jgi:hypothetical protein